MTHAEKIAATLGLKEKQVSSTIALLDEGNTLPFIARYRKEKTGELDEEQLRQITDQLSKLRALDDRRETILKAIEEQGKLSDGLRLQINKASSLTELEDLYQPYKQKQHTRAEKARQRGLQPLADLILAQESGPLNLNRLAQAYLGEALPDVNAVWNGARDIVAETIADHPEIRGEVRERGLKFAFLSADKINDAVDEKETYKLYYAFEQRINRLRPHQILALNRGENEKILKLKLLIDKRDWLRPVARRFLPRKQSPLASQLDLAIHDAAQRLLIPAIERDIRRHMTESAEGHAIDVFADNMRGLLNQPPLADHIVMGIDPAYRTGCKVAIIDRTGKVVETSTIYPHKPQSQWEAALKKLATLINKHRVTLISIGNGTASRETEKLVAELIGMLGRETSDLHYIIVNEAGASVYSASPLARDELPDLDVTLRGAVSIARRIQDPLAELVKIDPKAIGVGLYQHDVNQKSLSRTLDGVVESVVNQVGVDVNSASRALLTYVSGIGPRLAQNIVAYRDDNGSFGSRDALKKVSGLGPKAFEQAAGFLRIRDGKNWLDGSAIHPESYKLAQAVLKQAKIDFKGEGSIEGR
ncbi:MAG: Tex family protein, partial [Chloroflexota bacterium]